MIILYPFQSKALDELRDQIRASVRRLLLVAPTGAGKTSIASELIRSATSRGKRILFLAHRRELITQASKRLDSLAVDHGILMGNHWRDRPHLPVQVGSVQTVINRDLPWTPDIVVIDEAHRARGASYQNVIAQCGNPVVIGLTATPCRTDGRGLGGDLFEAMVQCPQIADLIAGGYLVPPTTYGATEIDLSGVSVRGGDYNAEELEATVNTAKLVGDVVAQWRKHAATRQTVVFAAGVKHSKALAQEFLDSGIRAEHLDGETPTAERDAILARLANRSTQVVVNCAVLTEGWDSPGVSCCVIARPTQSLSLYLQMAGRALRTAPGKSDCLILDHGNCWKIHGLVTDHRDWQLSSDRKPRKSKSLPQEDMVRVCPDCFRVAGAADSTCPCGYTFAVRKQTLPKTAPVELQVITEANISPAYTAQAKLEYERWLWQQTTLVKRDGTPYAGGYAFAKFVEKYRAKPPYAWKIAWEIKQRHRRA